MIKNFLGRFYRPEANFNNIEEMRVGEGYMVRVSEDGFIDFWG